MGRYYAIFSTESQVDHEAQGLLLADTFTPRQDIFDLTIFFDVLSTRALPGHAAAHLAGEIPLGEDVVRELRQAFTFEMRHIEADALGCSVGVPTMHIFVVHPDGRGDIRDNETERGLGRASSTTGEQVLDGAAGLQTHEGVVLPPGDRAPLGIHEALLENVVEDVFEVEEAHHVADVDELGGDLLLSAGRLVIGDPELGSLDLGAVNLRAVKLGTVR